MVDKLLEEQKSKIEAGNEEINRLNLELKKTQNAKNVIYF